MRDSALMPSAPNFLNFIPHRQFFGNPWLDPQPTWLLKNLKNIVAIFLMDFFHTNNIFKLFFDTKFLLMVCTVRWYLIGWAQKRGKKNKKRISEIHSYWKTAKQQKIFPWKSETIFFKFFFMLPRWDGWMDRAVNLVKSQS